MKRIGLFLCALTMLFMVACQNNDELLENVTDKGTPAEHRLWMVKEMLPQTKAVTITDKLWKSGDTIRIKFLNGDDMLQNRVKQYAAQWLEHACLFFEYTEGDADVKISFDWVEKLLAWSTIGTDCRLVPQNESSMNFVYLDDPDEDFVRGEVLRAFGHLLGLGFEHQNPVSPIVFKANAVSVLATNYGLDDMEAERFIEQYQENQTNYTEYDKTSIMVVELPRTILENRSHATTFNTELSVNDTKLISELYPELIKPKKLGFEVLVDGLYPTKDMFCIGFQKKYVYFLRPASFPIDYENGTVMLTKIDLEMGMETPLQTFYNTMIGDFVVDQYENYYVNLCDMAGHAIWKYDNNGNRQQLIVPDRLFEPRGNSIGIDQNGYVYATTLASNFSMGGGPSVDTTYIFRFDNTAYGIYGTCIKEIAHEYEGFMEMDLSGQNMLLHTLFSKKFYQMNLTDGNVLIEKELDLNTNGNGHLNFVVDRDSELAYLVLVEGDEYMTEVKNVLYRCFLDSGKTEYVGELPSKLTTTDGRILDGLQYCRGKVLNENELILAAIEGYGENTCLVKVSIAEAN